jgi:hypothetical protein
MCELNKKITGGDLKRVEMKIAIEHLSNKEAPMRAHEAIIVPFIWTDRKSNKIGIQWGVVHVLDMDIDLLLGLDFLDARGWQLDTKAGQLKSTQEGETIVLPTRKMTAGDYDKYSQRLNEVSEIHGGMYIRSE